MKLSVLRLRLKIPWDRNILVRVTNLGLGFVLTTLVVAIGATNTGNNGLYVLLSLLLGVLLVSGVVSRRNVEEVSVSISGPSEVFAGEPARFQVRLGNRGRRGKSALLVKVSGKAAPILFPELASSSEAERGVDLVFPRRGRHRVESILLFSGYPIGLPCRAVWGQWMSRGSSPGTASRSFRTSAPRPFLRGSIPSSTASRASGGGKSAGFGLGKTTRSSFTGWSRPLRKRPIG